MAYNINDYRHPPYIISSDPNQRFHDYGDNGRNSSINLGNLDVSTAANDTAFTSQMEIQEKESSDFLKILRGKKLGLKLTMDDPLLLKVLTPPPATVISSTNAFQFNALSIQIGSWIVSENDSILVCKSYPKKKSFAWEILKFGPQQRKYKIEFGWSNIQDIKTNIFPPKDRSPSLFFKLKSKPKIKIESCEPTGRKHSDWKETDYDFTSNDQASSSSNNTKLHRIEIKARVFEKYYHSIMQAHPDPEYYPYRMPTPTSYPEPSLVPNGPFTIHPSTSVHEATSGGVDSAENDAIIEDLAGVSAVPNINGSSSNSSLMIHPPRQLPSTSVHEASSGGIVSFEYDAIIDHPESFVSNVMNGSSSSLIIHPRQLSSVDEASSSGANPNYNNGLLQDIVAGFI